MKNKKTFLEKIKEELVKATAEVIAENKETEKWHLEHYKKPQKPKTKKEINEQSWRLVQKRLPRLLEKHAPLYDKKWDYKKESPWFKELENYTLKELEFIITSFSWHVIHEMREHHHYRIEKEYLAILNTVFGQRKYLLRKRFKYTKENIKKILWVNKRLIECFKKGYKEARLAGEPLKERKQNKDPFLDDCGANIRVYPFLLKYNAKEKYWDEPAGNFPRMNMDEVLNSVIPETASQWSKTDLDDDVSWTECLEGDVFEKNRICYAFHNLLCHSPWSLADIVRIKEFWTEVEVLHQNMDQKRYYGYCCDPFDVLRK
ncbi:MAG: hypothetical protein LBK69_06985 [Syntrophomonadaceae bacterium]|jgi:hypothetical protein|nr:hypothetical protein [Syntrophomonadaceae bacterium]